MRARRGRDVRRILVIQTAKIGDVICATPIFRALAQHFPEARVTALVNPITSELLEGNPYVHSVVTMTSDFASGFAGKWRLARLIRNGRYDVAVTLNPNTVFAVCLFWGLVPIRLSVMPDIAGSTFKLASGLFTYLAAHASDRLLLTTYLEALRFIGVHSQGLGKDVVRAPTANEKVAGLLVEITAPIAGIAVTSGNKLKEIRPEKVADLINALVARANVNIVLIGSEADRVHVRSITDRLSDPARVVDAVGRLRLNELPALFDRLAVFIGVDSGLTFMADACSTPIVEIAGPGPISEQRPLGKDCVIIEKSLPCVPCLHIFKTVYTCRIKTRDCVESVTTDEIVAATLSLLGNSDHDDRFENAVS